MASEILTLKGVILSYPNLIERGKMPNSDVEKYSTGIYISKKSASGKQVAAILATYPKSFQGSVNQQTAPIKDGDKQSISNGELVTDIIGKGMWKVHPYAKTLKGSLQSEDIPLYFRDVATGKAIKADRIKDKEQLEKMCYGGALADVKVAFFDSKGRQGCELLGVCFNGGGEPLGNFVPAPVATSDDFGEASDQVTQINPEALKQLAAQNAAADPDNTAAAEAMAEVGDDDVPF